MILYDIHVLLLCIVLFFLFIMPVLGWDICTRSRGSFQQNHEYHTLYDLHVPLPKEKKTSTMSLNV